MPNISGSPIKYAQGAILLHMIYNFFVFYQSANKFAVSLSKNEGKKETGNARLFFTLILVNARYFRGNRLSFGPADFRICRLALRFLRSVRHT